MINRRARDKLQSGNMKGTLGRNPDIRPDSLSVICLAIPLFRTFPPFLRHFALARFIIRQRIDNQAERRRKFAYGFRRDEVGRIAAVSWTCPADSISIQISHRPSASAVLMSININPRDVIDVSSAIN